VAIPVIVPHALRVQFPPPFGDVALREERERLSEARIIPEAGHHTSESLGTEVHVRQTQAVEHELRPADLVWRTFAELVRHDRVGRHEEILAQRPEPHAPLVIDVAALQLTIVPAAGGLDHVATRGKTAAWNDRRGRGPSRLPAPPAHFEARVPERQSIADA